MPFSLFLALKYLKPKRSFTSVVTVISVVGVLLGVAILVIVMSVMRGFDDMWREKILSFKPHLSVQSEGGVLLESEAASRAIEEIPGVVAASPSIETQVMVEYNHRIAAPRVVGIDPDRAVSINRIGENMVAGRLDVTEENAVMGRDLAYELGLAVGDRFLVYSPLNLIRPDELYLPEELTLAGMFDMGMRDFDSGFLLTSLWVARNLTGIEEGAYSIQVMTENPFRFEEFAAAVSERMGPGYRVRTWREIDQVLFTALSHEKTMMFVLLVFITIVAIFCVTNTVIVITVRKTDEIGLLKALGFSSGKIMRAFVWHGLIQCLAGTLLGIGAGVLVLHNLDGIVRVLAWMHVEVFPKSVYGLSDIPWRISGAEVARIAVVVMGFSTLAAYLPAWRAAKMDPVRALRHE